MMTDHVAKLIQLCSQIATIVESNKDHPICNDLGLGCFALSHYLREGIKETLDLQSACSKAVYNNEVAKESEKQARAFLEDVFGDSEIDFVNDDFKNELKAFAKELDEKYYGKDGTDDDA